jgi:hypothetical protein
MPISRDALLNLARAGATARVKELQQELDEIYQTFPDLRGSRGRQPAAAASQPQTTRRKPGRRSWSAADRKAAADRMKKYWANRKAKEGKAKDGKK